MTNTGYLPLHHQKKGFVVRLQLSKAAWITCLLPFTAFVFCIIWSLMYNFEDSTFTHCKVQNFLPSISAAIGNYRTQRFVWGTAIAIHALPRFMFAGFHRQYYRDVLNPKAQKLALAACILNVIENIALIGLTFITSAYNYAIHEKCFMTFMITSEVYMALTCYLLSKERRIPAGNVESRSLRYKYQLLVINMTSFAAAGYFFIRHNRHCEPYVYSAFAFFEYIVVLTNMAFHTTCSLDFHGRTLLIDQNGFDVIS
ncbi:post-GPI attachment to proteins factor [Nesidiocoris tenuis]|uniref:Post-GPI attachment to proteins factor n=2 Tax=Nesidiocoris tenuis TaxID=355587 RepID=A0ABN7ARX2_9HEMI|nr:post-GPI attachment to proteins factor [Nesidiocoris tenuis]